MEGHHRSQRLRFEIHVLMAHLKTLERLKQPYLQVWNAGLATGPAGLVHTVAGKILVGV